MPFPMELEEVSSLHKSGRVTVFYGSNENQVEADHGQWRCRGFLRTALAARRGSRHSPSLTAIVQSIRHRIDTIFVTTPKSKLYTSTLL